MISSKGARSLLKDVQFPGLIHSIPLLLCLVSMVTIHVHTGDVDGTYLLAVSRERRRVCPNGQL